MDSVERSDAARTASTMVALGSAVDLPQVLHSAPAAVLLINLDARQVVYANSVAVELSGPDLALPVDIDVWSAAAGLTDLAGMPMRDTTSPLSRVATGTPVAGEPVEVHDAARRGSEATEAQRDHAEGQMWWVTGFPLEPQRTALVVFLQLSSGSDHREQRLRALRDRAVVATDLSFTVSDPTRDDGPLIWTNPSFTRLTGYSPDEVIGHNCRFLQGPNTDRAVVARIRDALAEGRPVSETLLNYRKDGTAFWNQVSISPVRDSDGELVNFVGVQSDVTERVLVERERQLALASAEEARNDLQLLTEATTWMTGSLNVDDAADRLAHSVVPALADYCRVDLLDEPGGGRSRRVAALHRDDDARSDDAGGSTRTGAGGRGRFTPARMDGRDPVSRVLATGEPLLLGAVDGDQEWAASAEGRTPRSVMVLPLRARGQVLGTLLLGTEEPYGRRYGQRDLYLAHDLASKAALAVDNARLYAREHDAAETLQLSLLPKVPLVAGLHVATRYLVGSDGARVGGDWYDLIALPDGAVGLAVGDVVGHDLRAAAAMGQLRGVLRSYAWEGLAAGAVLDRCDQLVQGLEMAAMATAVYARLAPQRDGLREFSWSNAGHPAPLLRTPDGTVHALTGNLSPLLGAVPGVRRDRASLQLAPGSVLLLHTDGLIDVPGVDPDAQQERVEAILAEAPDQVDVDELCDRLVTELVPHGAPYDDIALLAVRVDA